MVEFYSRPPLVFRERPNGPLPSLSLFLLVILILIMKIKMEKINMKYLKLQKLANNKNILIITTAMAFFALFLNSFTLVAYAQYEGDAGGYYYDYPSAFDAGSYSYPSIGDAGAYDYPSAFDSGSYSYPSISYPGTYDYPVATYGDYTYPSLTYPGTYDYPVATYGDYTYPSLTYPGTNTYTPTTYGTYSYPQISYPGTSTYPPTSYGNYTYPSLSYPGGYNYLSFGGYPSTTAYAATVNQPANIPTGPEGALPWILFGGLMLSTVIYLALFKIRFREQLALTGVDYGALLERKLKKIRSEELKSDTDVDSFDVNK